MYGPLSVRDLKRGDWLRALANRSRDLPPGRDQRLYESLRIT